MDHPVVVAARGLASTLAAHTDDHVRARALAPAVIDALTAGDYWRLLVPRALGGLALAPADYVDVLTALATGDAASAWVVMTASTSTPNRTRRPSSSRQDPAGQARLSRSWSVPICRPRGRGTVASITSPSARRTTMSTKHGSAV